ncbi:hypothetical protein BH10PSE15_BH10PSE15_06720 [soil metagenome]
MDDDYTANFDKIISLVPKSDRLTSANQLLHLEYYGELLSGAPIIPIPKGEPERAEAIKKIKATAFNDSANFTTLADGMRHGALLKEWADGSIKTSCNAFAGYVTRQLGAPGLGGFNVEKILASKGKKHCWITPSSGEAPQYGDLFETRSITPGAGYENLHVGFSLSVVGDTWYTIEGGQGGPVAGADKIGRIKKKYRTEHLLGWGDMRMLLSGKPALPDWLTGSWMVYAGAQNFIYSIDRYGRVKHKAYQPIASQANTAPDLDAGTVLSTSGDTVKLKWNSELGIETLTYDRWNSVPAINERMKGQAADGSALTGVRL